jgi:hypothetical protein
VALGKHIICSGKRNIVYGRKLENLNGRGSSPNLDSPLSEKSLCHPFTGLICHNGPCCSFDKSINW